MTDFMTSLRKDLKTAVGYGEQIRLKFFTGSVSNEDYDDHQTLVQSGADVWSSGLMFPIKNTQGSNEAVLIEQGKIKTSDKIMFIAGDTATTQTMRIGLGSPVTEEYSIIPDGVLAYPPYGDAVYKKLYIRNLTTGSLSGEA